MLIEGVISLNMKAKLLHCEEEPIERRIILSSLRQLNPINFSAHVRGE